MNNNTNIPELKYSYMHDGQQGEPSIGFCPTAQLRKAINELPQARSASESHTLQIIKSLKYNELNSGI